MDFIRFKIVQDLLLYPGYILSKRKVLAAGETVWECTKKRNEHACDVTVKSLKGVIVPPVFPGDHDHLHAPDPDEIEVLLARSAMKRRAQDTAEPTQTIINRNIVPLPQQVLARIGTLPNRSKEALDVNEQTICQLCLTITTVQHTTAFYDIY